ncbi:transcriptional regulator, HxlR family protein [Candidatus Woesearchaeota archaeon CG10_big_fil_rev_8_21_14_0_10_37_12]|nr:MAG: transcriptional regulator, HxlR family protein [Candidatus Woesearchaeota archaeon CG10_big_fil_rev_8_21_14_0_10_37_12]
MKAKPVQTMPVGCKMKGQGYCPRPLECAAFFLSKKWTLSVLVTIGNFKQLRFNHLLDKLEEISPKVLSQRLSELENKKLITRTVFIEKPPRVEYALTKQGRNLYKSILPLMNWANNYEE